MTSAPDSDTGAERKPQHIAIVMDGNGRWATSRGLPRTEGHRKGAEAAQRAVEAAKKFGIPYVTLFSFSTENWNRPESEIGDLMNLMRLYLRRETAEMHKSGARLRVIGERHRLPDDIVKMIEKAEDVTKDNNDIHVTIALSYGGRQDIVHAAQQLAERVKAGEIEPDQIDDTVFADSLMTAGLPDPDLMIRTSGESRISNFLLWQLAYAELFFTPVLWPDFDETHMKEAIDFFASRERRYGGLGTTQKSNLS